MRGRCPHAGKGHAGEKGERQRCWVVLTGLLGPAGLWALSRLPGARQGGGGDGASHAGAR